MNGHTPIEYRGFWDVPRIFLVPYQGETFLFDCAFSEELDDYPDFYKVYLMPAVSGPDLPKDWTTLHTKATRLLGEVPVVRVRFDSSKRKSIDTGILEQFLVRKPVAG